MRRLQAEGFLDVLVVELGWANLSVLIGILASITLMWHLPFLFQIAMISRRCNLTFTRTSDG
jgi:hypothetical protein